MTRSIIMRVALSVLVAAYCGVAWSQDKAAPSQDKAVSGQANQEKKPAATPTHPGLEKLKQLAGEWSWTNRSPDEKAAQPAGGQADVVYKVISAGSAVHETLFPGTPHEMVTIYHADRKDLVLTHYCAAGNQPRMKAEPSSGPNKLVFKFTGGTNLNPAKDGHMHDLTITFVDADHIRCDWTSWENGKESGVKSFEFARRK